MKTTIESLKDLFEKLGGSEFNAETIPDAIDAVTSVAQSGGGGGEKFIVTVTGAEEDDDIVYSADKSVADCIAAYEANKVVVCHLGIGEDMYYELPIILALPETAVSFALSIGDDNGISTMYVGGDIDNTHDEWRVDLEENVGGSSKFVVTLVEDPETHDWSAQDGVTVEDCISAYNDGKIVECLLPVRGMYVILNLDYAIAEYNAVGFSNAFTGESIALFEAVGIKDGSGYEWRVRETALGIPSAYKPTYSFGFTATSDGQGGYTVTPDSGSTYAAITAALAETPNVYFDVLIDGSDRMVNVVNNIHTTAVYSCGVIYHATYGFTAYRMKIDNTDACDIIVTPLAARTT